MKIENRIIQKKKAVERELKRLLYRENSVLFQAMRHAVFSGGKRFRPLLALASGECFGLSERLMLPFACALELIHNYSLIHDDLPAMDDDDFRRGKPSCHKAYGEDIALLAGDSLLTMAFEVMSRASLEEKFLPRKEKVINEISQMAGSEGMIGGQFMDITASPDKMTEEEYYDLALKKTGSLIIASLKSGALLGNASSSQVKSLEEYGGAVGLAFQIRDDIMDSAEREKEKSFTCPNAVALFGLKEAKEKLRTLVDKALQSLEEARLDSEELRFLALKLLEYKSGDENG
jgi:geranylgeranyl diphosphate synthase type II